MTTTDVPSAGDGLAAKEKRLEKMLAAYGSMAVAYSGGVDSTYLADVAHEILGSNAWMIVADSPSMPRSELKEAVELAKGRGWRIDVLHTEEFENENYLRNDRGRCYFCRQELFKKMAAYAKCNGIAVLAYGATADDMADDTRVGHKAAAEYHVVAPLQEIGLTKDEIRELSRRRRLPTWDKASFACLSTRLPVGTPLSVEVLRQIQLAEEVLKGLGFRQYRARHHGNLCRIEIDIEDMGRMLEPGVRDAVVRAITALGYAYVCLDLAGYRTGSTARA